MQAQYHEVSVFPFSSYHLLQTSRSVRSTTFQGNCRPDAWLSDEHFPFTYSSSATSLHRPSLWNPWAMIKTVSTSFHRNQSKEGNLKMLLNDCSGRITSVNILPLPSPPGTWFELLDETCGFAFFHSYLPLSPKVEGGYIFTTVCLFVTCKNRRFFQV